MRILLTGNRGFVGSHIEEALLKDGHEVVGLGQTQEFQRWHEEMYDIMDTNIDAIVHNGAIAENQSQTRDIFLWNSHATFLLMQRARHKRAETGGFPVVFFSSHLVGVTEDDWEKRSPYTWSKAVAETYVQSEYPWATILRPGTIWGDNESRKKHKHRSLPYQLAAHQLTYLFKNYERHYIHVNDVVNAVKVSIAGVFIPVGTFCIYHPDLLTSQQVVNYSEYRDFEEIDDPHEYDYYDIIPDFPRSNVPLLPNWRAEVDMATELPKLERKLQRERD